MVIWKWTNTGQERFYPKIVDYFIGNAKQIAKLRDELHIARGGTFVSHDNCPDECMPDECLHHGEPLNASGKRERITGPISRRVSPTVSYASNFGGLVRMIKTNSPVARKKLRELRIQDSVIHNYISFIHRNYPAEERNQFSLIEWRQIAHKHNIATRGLSKDGIVNSVRESVSEYQELLRNITR